MNPFLYANHSVMQWASSTATMTRCFLTYDAEKILRQGVDITNSGDMNTTCVNTQDTSNSLPIEASYQTGTVQWLHHTIFQNCRPGV